MVNLPRSGWPTKITPRAQSRLIQEVIKKPRTTSKELQASFASIKVSVHDSTIRKRLGKKKLLIIPNNFGQIFCGLMRQKLNFLEGACPVTSGVKPTQDFIIRTSYQQSNMVVVFDGLRLLCSYRTWMTCHN